MVLLSKKKPSKFIPDGYSCVSLLHQISTRKVRRLSNVCFKTSFEVNVLLHTCFKTSLEVNADFSNSFSEWSKKDEVQDLDVMWSWFSANDMAIHTSYVEIIGTEIVEGLELQFYCRYTLHIYLELGINFLEATCSSNWERADFLFLSGAFSPLCEHGHN